MTFFNSKSSFLGLRKLFKLAWQLRACTVEEYAKLGSVPVLMYGDLGLGQGPISGEGPLPASQYLLFDLAEKSCEANTHESIDLVDSIVLSSPQSRSTDRLPA